MNKQKKSLLQTVQRAVLSAVIGFGPVIGAVHPSHAQGSGAIPVPAPRPKATAGTEQQVLSTPAETAAEVAAQPVSAETTGAVPAIPPVSGSLKQGLDALADKNTERALSIRNGMRKGSFERRVLDWSIALSGQPGIPSAEIARIAVEMPDWPGQEAMRRNSEAALAREGLGPKDVISAFGGSRPESLTGAVLLARSYMETGNRKAANAAIAPIWRSEKLSAGDEKYVIEKVGVALTKEDHRVRMHMQFYKDRAADGMRMASLAGQVSLAKARAAVIKQSKDAVALLAAVDPASRKDPGYLFAKIKQSRRDGNYKEAARLLLSAPRDQAALIDPDEWWVERRIVSREFLDMGDAATAYKLAAAHSAESPPDLAEAEFHAGWYALRFMNDRARAAKHFQKVIEASGTPITQARGQYWLARAKGGPAAMQHYRAAASHAGTYYGQLSAQHIGIARLDVSNPKPTVADRTRFASREQVRAIAALEDAGYPTRAEMIYRHLAESLDSPGELALLAARAEKRGNRSLALSVGKTAHQRGLEVDSVSWPIGAIPESARIGDTGRALAYSIARQESAFNVGAVSSANAQGLLQLLPGTAKMMAKKTGQPYKPKALTTDAAYNATLGAAYLSEQLDNFDNSYIMTFAGYNAGPGRVRDWIEQYGDPRGKDIDTVIDWVERIPFTETRNYVMRVMENYQVYKARLTNSRLDIEQDLRFGRR
jgi:soluble lytic murein transglycosylase